MIATPAAVPIDCGTRGGIVYAHSGDRVALRRRAAKRKARTFRQQIIRSDFASLAAQWSLGLSSAERESWDDFAAAIAEETSGCTPVTKNGYQWFQGTNLARTNATFRSGTNFARFTTAPSTADRGSAEPTITTVTRSGPAFSVTVTFTGVTGVVPIAFGYVSQAINESDSRVGDPWHLFGIGAGSAGASAITIVSNVETGDNWLADWPPALGQVVKLKVRVQFDDGRYTRAARNIKAVTAP